MHARGNWTWVALLAVAIGAYVAGAHRAPSAAAGPTREAGDTYVTNSAEGAVLTVWTLKEGRVVQAVTYSMMMTMKGAYLTSAVFEPMSSGKPEGK